MFCVKNIYKKIKLKILGIFCTIQLMLQLISKLCKYDYILHAYLFEHCRKCDSENPDSVKSVL